MKITLVADVYGQTNNGTSITALRLVENLKKKGHDVKVVSCFKDSDIVLPKRNFYCFNHYLEKTNGVELADVDDEKLKEGIAGSDVVHILLPFKVGIRAKKICQELHIPFTTAFHCQPENVSSHIGMKNWTFVNDALYKRFLRRFYHDVEFVHCPSKFIADELTAHNYKCQKYVISNGVVDYVKPNNAKKPKELEDKFCILFVARHSKEKRHDLLIKAAHLSKYKDKIQLIFGGQGPMTKKIEKMGKDLPNPPIIKFFSKEELVDAFNYVDLYSHPSDIEIEAISCLEAITCGQVPVISDSKRTATKQFALTDKNLFKAGNAQDLADTIDYWIEHPKEKAELKKKYLDYSKQFNIDYCIDKMVDMFKDAIAFYTEYYKNLPQKEEKAKSKQTKKSAKQS